MLLTQFSSFYVGQSAVKATFIASAIRKCGGNEEKGRLLYTAYGSNGQVSISNLLACKQVALDILQNQQFFPLLFR